MINSLAVWRASEPTSATLIRQFGGNVFFGKMFAELKASGESQLTDEAGVHFAKLRFRQVGACYVFDQAFCWYDTGEAVAALLDVT